MTPEEKNKLDLCTMVAEVCHEAHRTWQRVLGQSPNRPWATITERMRHDTVTSVWNILHDTFEGPEEMHDTWISEMLRDGWKFDQRKSVSRKKHPCLLPWSELEPEERLKGQMFWNIAKTLLVKEESE